MTRNVNATALLLSGLVAGILCSCGRPGGQEQGNSKPANALEEAALLMYGDPLPPKTAVVEEAAEIAFKQLLQGRVPQSRLLIIAQKLDAEEMPYSSEDLALLVALNVFKRPDMIARKNRLYDVQMTARMQAAEWYSEGKANGHLVMAFENTLYEEYRPGPE